MTPPWGVSSQSGRQTAKEEVPGPASQEPQSRGGDTCLRNEQGRPCREMGRGQQTTAARIREAGACHARPRCSCSTTAPAPCSVPTRGAQEPSGTPKGPQLTGVPPQSHMVRAREEEGPGPRGLTFPSGDPNLAPLCCFQGPQDVKPLHPRRPPGGRPCPAGNRAGWGSPSLPLLCWFSPAAPSPRDLCKSHSRIALQCQRQADGCQIWSWPQSITRLDRIVCNFFPSQRDQLFESIAQ